MTAEAPVAPEKAEPQPLLRLSMFASVKLTIALLALIGTTVLIGAWCPQEVAVGKDKVIEQFGPQVGEQMIRLGIADIFHSSWFLGLIGMLTVNMVACSFQRVFPKVRHYMMPLAFLAANSIGKLPFSKSVTLGIGAQDALPVLQAALKRRGYNITLNSDGTKLTAHWGKFGRLAATITHIGLLTLLAGVTITSWTGFTGFQSVPLYGDLSFEDSEHSKQWLGKLPPWRVHVDATRRENYPSGEAKQWYSTLSVLGAGNKVLAKKEISVNEPLSYEGVDIYQSSWGLQDLILKFNGHKQVLPLRPMGKLYAAFLSLDAQTVLIFSVHSQQDPVRVFAKIPQWPQPRILAVLNQGKSTSLGNVKVEYDSLIPVTGLQYKSDPGLPVTYVAFAFIMAGVMFAAVPYRQVWAAVEAADASLPACTLTTGGVSKKARTSFEKSLAKILQDLPGQIPTGSLPETLSASGATNDNQSIREEEPCQSCS